ncbi:MAG: hypothetical protein KA155_02105 [Alphaproteobacteria bacterium]|jgi:hypothetical protein|nr:hypothetical protein [Alphaproteobacteria bacterium]
MLAIVIPFSSAQAFTCLYDDSDRPTVESIENKSELVFTGNLKKREQGKNPPDTVLVFKVLKVHKGEYGQFKNIEVVGLVTGIGGSMKYEEGKNYTVAVRRAKKAEKYAAPFVNVASLCEVPVIVGAHQVRDSYSIKDVHEKTWFEKLIGK